MPNRPDISVCIATFKRPQGLARLLAALEQQTLSNFTVEVVVVDNDSLRSAQPVVQACSLQPKYFSEPIQNISLARNRTMDEAQGDWLAFIDDDEMPPSDWLLTFWNLTRQLPADGYVANVAPCAEGPVPSWMELELLYSQRRPDRKPLQPNSGATNNAFVRKNSIQGLRFDPQLGLTGGSDTQFFSQAMQRGCVFYSCAQPEVIDFIAPSRLSLGWLLRRNFHCGLNLGATRGARKALSSMVHLGLRLVLALVSWPKGPSQQVLHLCHVAFHAGRAWGVLSGKRFEVYRTPGATSSTAATRSAT